MIEVTKKDADKTKYSINPSRIVKVKAGPGNQAIIKMSNGEIYSVEESREKINEMILDYNRRLITESIINALKEVDPFAK